MKKIFNVYSRGDWLVTAGLFTITVTILGLYKELGWQGLLILTLLFFLIPIVYRVYFQKRQEKVFFGDQSFMIEFFEAVDIINKNKKHNVKDTKHEISLLSKTLEINGADCKSVITFYGKNVSSNLSHGIQIQTTGGSSVSVKSLGISCVDKTNKSIPTSPQTIYDGERKKIFFIPFSPPKARDEKFCLEYTEEHWVGAMRSDYDGILFYDHMYFSRGIEKAEVVLKFIKGEVDEVISFVYNIRSRLLSKDTKNLIHEVNPEEYKWKLSDFKENEVYFVMYKHK